MAQSSSFSRRRLLQTTAAAAAVAGTSRYSFPSYQVSAQDENPLNTIFGPGGVEGGEGIDLQGGMNLAMTGQGAFFGDVMSKGALLAAEQIGAAGGPAITITINDHESGEVPPSVNGVRKLISQNGISFLQTSYGAPSEALIPILQQNKILTFNGGGASPKQLFADYLWMTRMVFAYDPAPGALTWLAETYPDVKRLATIGTLENGVEALEQLVPQVWPEVSDGGEVVAKEIHDVGLTDFSQVIARVKSSNPDAIFTVSFGNDLGYLVKQFREAAVEVPIVGIEFTQDAQTIAGPSYDTFVFATDYYDTKNENPWNVEFVKAHNEKYQKDPEYYGANYYEQVFVVWDLVRRVLAEGGDPKSGEALQNALVQNPVFHSVYGGDAENVGEMSFDTESHTISKPMGVFAVKDGQPSLLQPIPPELVPPAQRPA
ncbi:MAG: ABC transporter substrate-binding protein [Thermomicrobiales bacterium]|nr:ABC transporter substrate-binding protein [Chloroflexia bacterium]